MIVIVFAVLLPHFGEASNILFAFQVATAEGQEQPIIPEAFSLEESDIGVEQHSGLWSYAIRDTDGWAVLTNYHGQSDNIQIP